MCASSLADISDWPFSSFLPVVPGSAWCVPHPGARPLTCPSDLVSSVVLCWVNRMKCCVFPSNDDFLLSRCVSPVFLCLLPDFFLRSFCDCLSPPGCPPPLHSFHFVIVIFIFSNIRWTNKRLMWGAALFLFVFLFLMQLSHPPYLPPTRARAWSPQAGAEGVDGCWCRGLCVVVLL